MPATRKRNIAAGIWEIKDVKTGERISKFRARKRADVDRYLRMAEIGLERPATDFEAVFITEWESSDDGNTSTPSSGANA
jgi:hypothetical protein